MIEEFNRYNVVQLHVASPQLAQRSVSGVFDASEPESFIGFMQVGGTGERAPGRTGHHDRVGALTPCGQGSTARGVRSHLELREVPDDRVLGRGGELLRTGGIPRA